jgi:hypothetical protein
MNLEEKKALIVKYMKKPSTANEIISRIYSDDCERNIAFRRGRGWRFYVHLNKLFAPMSRDKIIKLEGEKDGEKLWMVK